MAEQNTSGPGLLARWRERRRRKHERTGDSPEKSAARHTPKRDAMDMWLRSGGVERETRFKR